MKKHIGSLDGIRACLAMWVFWGHLANAVAFDAPLLRAPALAVDLFMLLSGFLMSWHWEVDRASPWRYSGSKRVLQFWIRRFFRIAPLYYVLLVLAILLNPKFIAARDHLQAALHTSAPTSQGPGPGQKPPLASPVNIVAHATFFYGFNPKMAANDALPDWSLSLEMQFYLVFPLLIALCRPARIVIYSVASLLIALVAARLFGIGSLSIGSLAQFPQPSILPLKIHIFASGMALGCLAAGGAHARSRVQYWIAFLLPLAFAPKPVWAVALVVSALILSDLGPLRWTAGILGSAPFRLGADLSYGVYLVHYLPSYLLLDLALRRGLLNGLSSGGRFAAAAGLLTGPILLAAYVFHRVVEKPGIRLGKAAAKVLASSLKPAVARAVGDPVHREPITPS